MNRAEGKKKGRPKAIHTLVAHCGARAGGWRPISHRQRRPLGRNTHHSVGVASVTTPSEIIVSSGKGGPNALLLHRLDNNVQCNGQDIGVRANVVAWRPARV